MVWSYQVAHCEREEGAGSKSSKIFVMETLRWPIVADEMCCIGSWEVWHYGTEVDSTSNLVALSPNDLCVMATYSATAIGGICVVSDLLVPRSDGILHWKNRKRASPEIFSNRGKSGVSLPWLLEVYVMFEFASLCPTSCSLRQVWIPTHVQHVAGWGVHSRPESVVRSHTFLNKLCISNIRQRLRLI